MPRHGWFKSRILSGLLGPTCPKFHTQSLSLSRHGPTIGSTTKRSHQFGDFFIDLVKLLFNGIETCVINAGNTSSYFSPKRGIRQGCCVSPYLFNIVVEVMAILIRQNNNIKGVVFQNSEVKLSQFADDSTYFLHHLDSLDRLLDFLDTFSNWSGLKLNRSKSSILPARSSTLLGAKYRSIPVVTEAKILGLWFSTDDSTQNRFQLNFKPLLQRIKSTCDSWAFRDLSLKGKVTVANSLLVSRLQYPTAVTFTPPQVFTDHRRIVTDFVWNGRKPKVAYKTLILPVAKGGLGLMDLQTRANVSAIQWVRRILLNRAPNVALTLAHFIGTQDLPAVLSSKPKLPPLGIKHDPFYTSLFKLWDQLHGFHPEGEDGIRNEIIWDNKWVSPGTFTGARVPWEAKGIRTIHDICHPTEGRLLSHQELSDRYEVRCSFLDMLSLRLSIPLGWRQSISPGWTPTPGDALRSGALISLPNEQPMDVLNVSPRQLYRAFITKMEHSSTAFGSWRQAGEQDLRIADADEWREISTNVYRATRETKLQALHFKIINRIIPCGTFLRQLRILQNDACAFCGLQDSLAHFLYDCAQNKSFWHSVCAWFERVEDLRLKELSRKQFLLGLCHLDPKGNKINAILISVKFYIHRQRLFHQGQLDLLHWLREFRARLLVEREICKRENRQRRFNTWNHILGAMG